MTSKKNDALMKVQKEENTQISEVEGVTIAEVKELTPEELKAENERLKRQLSGIPTDLKARVEYFSHKNELIRRMGKLDNDKENLNKHLDRLAEISTSNEFENEEYFLNIEGGGKYNKTMVYTVKNPVIIGELIQFIIARIEDRAGVLKKEIEA